nr:MAG TPA: YopX protein [Caudoviricetes sp.]
MIPKFRAWDRTKNEMNYRVMVGNCDTDDENWTCPIIWDEEREKWVHFDDYECIMQSTGLKDKNGKEIFEGDIITNGQNVMCMKRHNTLGFYVEEKGEVEFIAGCAVLEDFEEDAKEIADRVEIIGNIYENQEILEEEE